MSELSAFADPKYDPFEFKADTNKVALLIHGFPGTPYEMRMIGEIVQDSGYSANGILLPGFGSEISTLGEKSKEDWYNYVKQIILEVQKTTEELILVGYSFGAALTINVIVDNSEINPDRLILIAPFWNLFAQYNWAVRFFGPMLIPVVRLFSPKFKIYRNIDFDNLSDRAELRETFDTIDLDDPEVQEFIKNITIPFNLIDEIYKVGKSAQQKIESVNCKILILQGKNDQIVPPWATEKLLANNGYIEYHLISGLDHEFIKPDRKNRDKVEDIITQFLQ